MAELANRMGLDMAWAFARCGNTIMARYTGGRADRAVIEDHARHDRKSSGTVAGLATGGGGNMGCRLANRQHGVMTLFATGG